jgi:hypothetical protein
MAETQNEPFMPDPSVDIAGSIAGLLFEARVAAAAAHLGIQMLTKHTGASPLREELAVLQKLSGQNCVTMGALQKVIFDHLTQVAWPMPEIPYAHCYADPHAPSRNTAYPPLFPSWGNLRPRSSRGDFPSPDTASLR